MYLGMYFVAKIGLMFNLVTFVLVLTHEFDMSFVVQGGTKISVTVTQRHSASPLENSCLFHLKNVSGTDLLILLH